MPSDTVSHYHSPGGHQSDQYIDHHKFTIKFACSNFRPAGGPADPLLPKRKRSSSLRTAATKTNRSECWVEFWREKFSRREIALRFQSDRMLNRAGLLPFAANPKEDLDFEITKADS